MTNRLHRLRKNAIAAWQKWFEREQLDDDPRAAATSVVDHEIEQALERALAAAQEERRA